MAKKELRTEVKRLRLTEVEAMQLEKYLDDHDLNFSEFVNALIGQKIMPNSRLYPVKLLTFQLSQRKSESKSRNHQKQTQPYFFKLVESGTTSTS
jgi:hypothetical protein